MKENTAWAKLEVLADNVKDQTKYLRSKYFEEDHLLDKYEKDIISLKKVLESIETEINNFKYQDLQILLIEKIKLIINDYRRI